MPKLPKNDRKPHEPLNDKRHEKYCQHVVLDCLSKAQAYKKAGFKGKNIYQLAYQLEKQNPLILERIKELQEEVRDEYNITSKFLYELRIRSIKKIKELQDSDDDKTALNAAKASLDYTELKIAKMEANFSTLVSSAKDLTDEEIAKRIRELNSEFSELSDIFADGSDGDEN